LYVHSLKFQIFKNSKIQQNKEPINFETFNISQEEIEYPTSWPQQWEGLSENDKKEHWRAILKIKEYLVDKKVNKRTELEIRKLYDIKISIPTLKKIVSGDYSHLVGNKLLKYSALSSTLSITISLLC
jgi:hypothetical protein